VGAWDFGPLDNDTAQDVYQEFMRLYDAGQEARAIREVLVSDWEPEAVGEWERVHFFSGLVFALWECGAANNSDIVELERMLNDRPSLQDVMDERVLAAASIKLIEKLRSPPKRIRTRRKRPPPRAPLLVVGDCIAFSLGEGAFGGAVVTNLNIRDGRASGYRLVPMEYIGPTVPDARDFERRNWIIEDFSAERRASASWNSMWHSRENMNYSDRPYHIWIEHSEVKKEKGKLYRLVCRISIGPDDPINSVPQDKSPSDIGYNWVGARSGQLASLIETTKLYLDRRRLT